MTPCKERDNQILASHSFQWVNIGNNVRRIDSRGDAETRRILGNMTGLEGKLSAPLRESNPLENCEESQFLLGHSRRDRISGK